ncbi:MAG: HypC/HybG/HupF family hydrogenase formation chaperone [Hydrogenophaga sp.]|nr:HypC/HybG/HupF family hydrogenase formation chaperone [Gammaproteobacteria bacterium]
MCLAIPARVVTVDRDGGTAVVSLGGVKKEVSTALLEDVAVDDYVLIHVGFALHKIDPVEAERTLALFAQAGLVGGP